MISWIKIVRIRASKRSLTKQEKERCVNEYVRNIRIHRERSDQGCDEDEEGKQSGHIGFGEHGTDNSQVVGVGDGVGGSLADEWEDHDQQNDELVHLIFMIYQIKHLLI